MMKPLFWIDLEMTGLDEKVDVILEVAAILTDWNLKPFAEFHRIVYQPREVLDRMDEWCVKTHGASGLTAQVPNGVPIETVENELVEFLEKNYKKPNKLILAGNSVWNDRIFITKQLPKVAKLLHYRMVDVSSFKEVFREKFGVKVEKKNGHRAVDDIFASISELETYLSYFKPREFTTASIGDNKNDKEGK